MFSDNAEVIKRKYTIISYKKKDSFTFKKLLKYTIYVLVLIVISIITYLSMNHII
jgi:hypothetical protein